MTLEELRAVGEALYGPRWQSEAARALRVSDRTIRRWAAGEWPVPDAVQAEIWALARARHQALGELIKTHAPKAEAPPLAGSGSR